ncbi:MAG: TonB-dependent receptor [Acidobacteriota bacterium]|nr:TonB-dependent receptor [Acidobacteriota bacterium]
MSLFAPLAFAQSTGSISGKVTMPDGSPLPGVTIEASANVLPTPRVAVSDENGEYRLPALPPGSYTLKFTLSGMQDITRPMQVQLGFDARAANVQMSVQGVTENVTVTGGVSYVDRGSAALSSGVTSRELSAIPTGQDYRDLLKLIPGVQFTQDFVRGPSAGGNGQDNVYQLDGVNVTLPLFGTMSAEPASHDIEQVTVVKGGARAVGFDRSGGFTIDSVSKSGTNRFAGMLQYQFQNPDLTADLESGTVSRFEEDRSWITGNVGGPIIADKLFFFASYYRPDRTRENRSNAYGELPGFESDRNEGFGKLTFSPSGNILLNGSYRDSKRTESGGLFGQFSTGTTGAGSESRQRIYTGEASWVVNSRSHFTGKVTRFGLETLGQPDTVSGATPNTAIGSTIDVNALDTMGRFFVPTPVASNATQSAFVAPIIARYGYANASGVRTGGGIVGYGSQFDDNDFFRTEAKVGYNYSFGSAMRHDLHVGYQWYRDEEDLLRSSNGWGGISAPGGTISTSGTPVFYRAQVLQQGLLGLPTIHSEYASHNIEVNDTIRWNNFTVNLGLIASNDTLYGQGLRDDASTTSGYTLAPGEKYTMYDLPFSKMLQPRLSATWAFNGRDTVYGSYARYHPAASSLPRAASWARNLAVTLNFDFDAAGRLFAVQAERASAGKLFVDDMDPRQIDEFLVGTSFQLANTWSTRIYTRYREGSNFWEDVPNTGRLIADTPDDIKAKGLYIADLAAQNAQIGGAPTSYVIAELDGAYTKYQEFTLESEWRGPKAGVNGSYTFSKYWGNFDQDNTTSANDANSFIGSSFIGDGAGRQLHNFRDGRLRGDRPHVLKVYGYYMFQWNGTLGAYGVAQSGQPWEIWNRVPYLAIGGDNSDSSKYAEPAGSRRSDKHYQIDLKYTQDFRFMSRYGFQIMGDLYNAFDVQTGYNIEPAVAAAGFSQPRSFYDPRRFQLSARFTF